MSRSRAKYPGHGWCRTNAGTQAGFRQYEHGRERAAVRDRLIREDWESLPHPKEFGNEWNSPRDGKGYYEEGRYTEHKDCDERYGFCPKCEYNSIMRR